MLETDAAKKPPDFPRSMAAPYYRERVKGMEITVSAAGYKDYYCRERYVDRYLAIGEEP